MGKKADTSDWGEEETDGKEQKREVKVEDGEEEGGDRLQKRRRQGKEKGKNYDYGTDYIQKEENKVKM